MASGETVEERYLRALRRLRKRAQTLEQMAVWRQELDARLWRAEVVLLATGVAIYDIDSLEKEIEQFRIVTAIIAKNGDESG